MARKNLLSEGEVRQFMKLANLGTLSENYFTNNPLEEESEEEFELHATEDELGAEDHFADEEADELGALEDEGGEEISAELEDKLAQGVEALAAAWGIEDRVDVEGGEEGGEDLEAVDMEMDMGGEEVDVLDVGEEEPAGPYQELDEAGGANPFKPPPGQGQSTASGPQGSGVPTGGGRGAKDDYDCEVGQKAWKGRCVSPQEYQKLAAAAQAQSGGGLEEEIDDDAIVAEVARRVAKRLKAENRKEVMANQLAERFFARLTQK